MNDAKEQVAFNKLIIIAKRYSGALMKLAQDDNELKGIYENLLLVDETINSCDDLKTFLSHPSFSKDAKKEMLEEIFKDKISQNILNFLSILLDRNRIFALGAILHSLKSMMDKKHNLLVIRAVSAIEISEDLKQKLKQKLETICEKQVNLETHTDESLIAGMVLKIGDKTIDGSIKSKLENLKRALIQK